MHLLSGLIIFQVSLVTLQGDTGSIIQYDELNRRWSLKKNGALVMSTGLEKIVSYGLRTLTWKLEKEICSTDNMNLAIHGLLTVCSVSTTRNS